ncbi:MAG: nucleoside triphosphate pyrophosphohydrolase [Gammaproteobacteria bacterium]|nr:nucleoside triphosphate pyrophosphohydrolase [Gammaproteobacteria bacterium]
MVTDNIEKLLDIMVRLRDPATGCPWDREQDFRSIAPYTIEEAYEVADAIERGDHAGLREELGDLLLQVVFHAQMARELGEFGFDDVVAGICDKLIRRHPHVFGGERIASADEQRLAWERLKAAERARDQVLGGVARAIPALARAAKLGRRAAGVGFDWPDLAGVAAKVREELEEVEAAAAASPGTLGEEIGDLLFAVTSLARHAGVDPEEALRQANAKFERRFAHVEQRVDEDGRGWAALTAGELDRFWREAKLRG